jgi:hypothetical protein
MKHRIIIFCVALLMVSCNNGVSQSIGVSDYTIKNDTLWVVSGDEFLYYPFGIYEDLNEFAAPYSFMNVSPLISDNSLLDILYFERNSIVTVFDVENTGKIEIVYVKILDSTIVLSNGIKVGLDKSEFMRYIPVTFQQSEQDIIHVVLLQSELLGIWNYYYFSNNKLDSILFISDYEYKLPYEYPLTFADKQIVIAFVAVDGKIKAIDKNNNQLFTVFNIDNGPDYEKEGLIRIVDDSTGLIGFADMEGHIVISPKYFFAYPFEQGLSAFNEGGKKEKMDEYHYTAGGKWGFIDKKGEVVFPPVFDSVSNLDNGKTEVKINNYHFYLYKKE